MSWWIIVNHRHLLGYKFPPVGVTGVLGAAHESKVGGILPRWEDIFESYPHAEVAGEAAFQVLLAMYLLRAPWYGEVRCLRDLTYLTSPNKPDIGRPWKG